MKVFNHFIFFYCSYACGRLCGEEAIICIRKINDKWIIEKNPPEIPKNLVIFLNEYFNRKANDVKGLEVKHFHNSTLLYSQLTLQYTQ
mgnify:CR=1 FL=1